MRDLEKRWGGVSLGVLALLTLSCTKTTLVHQERVTGWQGQRPVLAAGSAIESSYEVHAHNVTGQLLWSARCVLEESTERIAETREDSAPHHLAGTAWLVAGALGVAAASATLVASSNAPGPGPCAPPDDVECSNERGTLLGAGVGLAVLGAAALAAGTTTFLQPEQSRVVLQTRVDQITRDPTPVACGSVKDLAGAEIALRRPGLPEERAFVDETGAFVIELDDGSNSAGAAPRTTAGPAQLVLVHAPVTMVGLVTAPSILATFPDPSLP